MTASISVHLTTLGCARNDVDSEELAARMQADGFELVSDATDAEVVVVNTCGFIDAAKKDSIDTLLAAADLKQHGRARAVVAVGCLAERYGRELAGSLPEADAVLGFDDYPAIAARLRSILDGDIPAPHVPRDRRSLLPLSPAQRPMAKAAVPGHQGELPAGLAPASGPQVLRRRLSDSMVAPLKIASGCDRRCAFCAIPTFRGAYLSRPADAIVAEARWLVEHGVHEVLLVSENSSSYGKDLGDLRALEALLGRLSQVEGLDWIRVSYLQPAEVRPSLIDVMTSTAKVVPYFDLSFQHASGSVLRRMRRFGDAESFLDLIGRIRDRAPLAGIRSNVIVGFPGETEDDVQVLTDFLTQARLDVVGVFGYSDEEGTEAAQLDAHLDADVIEARYRQVNDLVSYLCDARAEERIGERTHVLIESISGEGVLGRTTHQGPETDGNIQLVGELPQLRPGQLVSVVITGSSGVDLVGEVAG